MLLEFDECTCISPISMTFATCINIAYLSTKHDDIGIIIFVVFKGQPYFPYKSVLGPKLK